MEIDSESSASSRKIAQILASQPDKKMSYCLEYFVQKGATEPVRRTVEGFVKEACGEKSKLSFTEECMPPTSGRQKGLDSGFSAADPVTGSAGAKLRETMSFTGLSANEKTEIKKLIIEDEAKGAEGASREDPDYTPMSWEQKWTLDMM